MVKKIHPVDIKNGSKDLFSMFLSQCLQKERSVDMNTIIEKLKRLYEQLDNSYAQSQEFAGLLSRKRECLLKDDCRVYIHMEEVREEMKLRKRGKVIIPYEPANADTDITENEDDIAPVEDEDPEATQTKIRKIKLLEKTMQKCEKKIKMLEEAEVNFDEENDSSFLKLERYKARMVELYKKWCKYTGNHKDAGRSYLQPKHYKLTEIVCVDKAINSFINTSLDKRRDKFFPDYVDILKLIHKYNIDKKLGMNAKEEKKKGKYLFFQLYKLVLIFINKHWIF